MQTYGAGLGLVAVMAGPGLALSPQTDARAGINAFVENCFSPFLTAETAAVAFDLPHIDYDFYDLDPFLDVAPSPPTGRAVAKGTDRRCEVSFAFDHAEDAAGAVVAALQSEGITTNAPLPETYEPADGTRLLAARYLNPRRIAVVHVGTRRGISGEIETFLNVERLRPLDVN